MYPNRLLHEPTVFTASSVYSDGTFLPEGLHGTSIHYRLQRLHSLVLRLRNCSADTWSRTSLYNVA